MSSIKSLTAVVALLGAVLACVGAQAQAPASPAAPAAAPQSGPGVQAPRDSQLCVVRRRQLQESAGSARGPAAACRRRRPPQHRDYKVAAIAGVIAAGATWKTIWTGTGNNADGPVATADGGMLFAQNTDSKVMKLDARRQGVVSVLRHEYRRRARDEQERRAVHAAARVAAGDLAARAEAPDVSRTRSWASRSTAPAGC